MTRPLDFRRHLPAAGSQSHANQTERRPLSAVDFSVTVAPSRLKFRRRRCGWCAPSVGLAQLEVRVKLAACFRTWQISFGSMSDNRSVAPAIGSIECGGCNGSCGNTPAPCARRICAFRR
jgi:hypothetical protein